VVLRSIGLYIGLFSLRDRSRFKVYTGFCKAYLPRYTVGGGQAEYKSQESR
jgi:hypothetical protein